MTYHHRKCPKLLFWDGGESVSCLCPRGWPKQELPFDILTKTCYTVDVREKTPSDAEDWQVRDR